MLLPPELACESLYRSDVNTLGKFMMLSKDWKCRFDQNVNEICYKVFAALATYTPRTHQDDPEKHLVRAKKHIDKLIRREKTIRNLLKLKPYKLEVLDKGFFFKFSSWLDVDGRVELKRFGFTGTQAIFAVRNKRSCRESLINSNSIITEIHSQYMPYFSNPQIYFYNFPFECEGVLLPNDRKKDYVKVVGKFITSYWNATTLQCLFATDRSHPLLSIQGNLFLYLKEKNRLSLWDILKRKEVLEVNLPCDVNQINVNQIKAIYTKDKYYIWINNKILYSIGLTPEPTASLIFEAKTELKGTVLTEDLVFKQEMGNTFVVDTKEGRLVREFIDMDYVGQSVFNLVLENCSADEIKILSKKKFETIFTIQAKAETTIAFFKNKLVLIDENHDDHMHIEIWNIDTCEQLNYFDIKEKNYKLQKTLADAHILFVLLQNDQKSQCCIFIDLATGRYLARKYISGGEHYFFTLSQLAYCKKNTSEQGFVIENYEG